MCSHYQTLKDAELLLRRFGVTKPGMLGKYDMWPRYQGVFVRRPPEHDAGDEAVPESEAVAGRWGLISALTKPTVWTRPRSYPRSTLVVKARQYLSPLAMLGAAGSIASFRPMPFSSRTGAQAKP